MQALTTATEKQLESLGRARNGVSVRNDIAVIEGFAARGIPAGEIQPRANVFTYNAWRAVGRQVRRGERALKILTYIPIDEERDASGCVTRAAGSRPKTASVFHVSQTDACALGAV